MLMNRDSSTLLMRMRPLTSTIHEGAVPRGAPMRSLARGFVLAMAIAAQSPSVSANASTEPPSCLQSSPHVQASFVLNDDGPRARITSVKVTGLDPNECNDAPVNLR